MSTNFENLEEKRINLSMEDMIFVDEILNERKIIINSPLVDVVKNDLDRAATLTRYVFFFKLNSFQPFALTDQKVADSLRISVKKIERAKAWLKEHDFISVKRVGIPAVGYITVNISKVKELYRLMESSSPYSGNWNPVFGEHIYNIQKRDILESIQENTQRSLETEKNIPASGSPSSPKVDEFCLAENVFENRFWVLVQNKVGKEQSKQRFFQITNNCKNEKKVNEVIEGYKRYLSFLAKNKANNFNRRAKDPATFLNIENKLWLEPWKFVKEEVAVSAGGSRIKQPKNWQDRIGVAKSLGLLDDFEQEEIREMYKEWKFVPHKAKQAIASEAVDNRLKQIDEYRKTEKERQQKEERERKKQKNARLARDYEDEYQSLKAVLNFDYENLEDALNHGERVLYEVVNKILEYEQKQEEKEAEIKRQQELEQKKIEVENSKIALEEAEKDLWTYVEKTVDVNAYLDRNKKKFPKSYEKFKTLFSNGETITDVVFGEQSKNPVVDSLKNNLLVFFMHEMSNDEFRSLWSKRNDAWTKFNLLQKEII